MAHDITDNFRSILDDAEKLFEGVAPFGEQDRIQARNRFRAWRTRLDEPCRVAVVGLVKAGKSTFVNALMGQDWAKVDARPATGTICTMTNHEAPNPLKPVLGHYKEASRPATWMTLQEAQNLQSTTEEVLTQAADFEYLEFAMGKNASPMLLDFELVDTPGIAAIVGEGADHDRITYGFLEKADALILVDNEYLEENSLPLLKQYCEHCHHDMQKADSSVFIIASRVDENCGGTMEGLSQKKQEREKNIHHQAVTNFDMPHASKVMGISALLDNFLRQIGDMRFAELHRQVRAGNIQPLAELAETLPSQLCELLYNAIQEETDPTLLAARLRYLSGVEEAKKYILREMRIRKTVLRIERLWKEVKAYLEWDLNRLAMQRQDAIRQEQEAFGRFCRMVESDKDFRSGKLGDALSEFIKNFRNDSYKAFEQQRQVLVTRLQDLGEDIKRHQLLADVYSRFCAERATFSSKEAEEISRLCGMHTEAFTTTADEARERSRYWGWKAGENPLSANLFNDIATIYAKWWDTLISAQH